MLNPELQILLQLIKEGVGVVSPKATILYHPFLGVNCTEHNSDIQSRYSYNRLLDSTGSLVVFSPCCWERAFLDNQRKLDYLSIILTLIIIQHLQYISSSLNGQDSFAAETTLYFSKTKKSHCKIKRGSPLWKSKIRVEYRRQRQAG